MMPPKVTKRTQSIITGKENLQKVWDLPGLPFTEFFGEYNSTFPKVDQALMLCSESGVFQLQYEVDPGFLYHSNNYNFRTLTTPKIKHELDFFIQSSSLTSLLTSKSRVLEIGGNNSVMADRLKGHYSKYVVCDPILDEHEDGLIEFWGGMLEEKIELVEQLQPTVVIGRHVLEHVSAPITLINSILERINGDVTFVFEFPNFRLMQQRQRFDAVFHQHLNYFDEGSIQKLISVLGCKLLSLQSNLEGSNGGSLVVSFTNNLHAQPLRILEDHPFNGNSMDNFDNSLALFKSQADLLSETIATWKGDKFGFGAGLMLATLNYHLNDQVANFSAIFDDDDSKANSGYQNLSIEIKSTRELVDLERNLILVTSMENQRRVRARLLDYPKSTIVGFQVN
jgi:hypothetical protein